MKPGFTVMIKVRKPVAEVFAAVQDPEQLRDYFATGGASGALEAGTTVIWRFADHPGDAPVHVREVVPQQRIVFEWPNGEEASGVDAPMCRVEIAFEALDDRSTRVTISETGWPATEAGLARSYGNCMGWSHMLAFLKAHLEYGVNLREGAY